MCWAQRCCFFVPLDLGCIILGIISFVISTFMTITSIVLLAIERSHQNQFLEAGGSAPTTHFLYQVIPLSKVSLDTIVDVTMFIGMLWMLFSVLLILGIRKNRPNLVVSSFAFGLVLTILSQLGALLLLLQIYWIAAIILFTLSLINIHYLVVIHTVYEQMVRGKQFGFSQHVELDEELDNSQ